MLLEEHDLKKTAACLDHRRERFATLLSAAAKLLSVDDLPLPQSVEIPSGEEIVELLQDRSDARTKLSGVRSRLSCM